MSRRGSFAASGGATDGFMSVLTSTGRNGNWWWDILCVQNEKYASNQRYAPKSPRESVLGIVCLYASFGTLVLPDGTMSERTDSNGKTLLDISGCKMQAIKKTHQSSVSLSWISPEIYPNLHSPLLLYLIMAVEEWIRKGINKCNWWFDISFVQDAKMPAIKKTHQSSVSLP